MQSPSEHCASVSVSNKVRARGISNCIKECKTHDKNVAHNIECSPECHRGKECNNNLLRNSHMFNSLSKLRLESKVVGKELQYVVYST